MWKDVCERGGASVRGGGIRQYEGACAVSKKSKMHMGNGDGGTCVK